MRNGIIIPILLIMLFFLSNLPESISFSPRSMNIRALAKVLILTAGILCGSKNHGIFIILTDQHFDMG